MHEFTPWPKTPRLFRDIVVTEKLDGTNAAIHISAVADNALHEADGDRLTYVDGKWFALSVQSRKRMITPGKSTDNYGFAGWVNDNAAQLVRLLGEGIHYGEWWGQGIQRGYGLETRRFSLFNTARHAGVLVKVGAAYVDTVPVLYTGTFSEGEIWGAVDKLKLSGSVAAPGFMNPEGVCVFHKASGRVFKVTADHQDGNPEQLASGPLNDAPRRDLSKWEA
ncbi:RNA ligase family protein [Streptomyces iakyrus]|uniref:RNA ligase family protein n=1 Tax=Streptomyces iakyrus TaxID=68219 RepID=UPI0036C06316